MWDPTYLRHITSTTRPGSCNQLPITLAYSPEEKKNREAGYIWIKVCITVSHGCAAVAILYMPEAKSINSSVARHKTPP